MTTAVRAVSVLGRCVEAVSYRGFALYEAFRRWLGCPAVRSITVPELHRALSAEVPTVVLIDVRSEQERNVSRIPTAITLDEFLHEPDKYRGLTVVPYCTLGGRSYIQARRLAGKGADVRNLSEGIVGWCRAGLPLQTPDNLPTNKVHTHWQMFAVPEPYEFSKAKHSGCPHDDC